MTMPIDLVLVRHGQSLLNLANQYSRAGDHRFFTPEFKAMHSSKAPLTERGIEQAKEAGRYLREELRFDTFDRYYCSSYVRAYETAAHLNFQDAQWKKEPDLREREWGDLDVMPQDERRAKYSDFLDLLGTEPFLRKTPNGESIAELRRRVRGGILGTLHRECSDMRVILVAHAETILAAQTLIERMSEEEFLRRENSGSDLYHIFNCQIIHYSRRDPETGKLSKNADWVRSICPWDTSRSSNSWQKIVRRQYSNEELLESAAFYRKLVVGTLPEGEIPPPLDDEI